MYSFFKHFLKHFKNEGLGGWAYSIEWGKIRKCQLFYPVVLVWPDDGFGCSMVSSFFRSLFIQYIQDIHPNCCSQHIYDWNVILQKWKCTAQFMVGKNWNGLLSLCWKIHYSYMANRLLQVYISHKREPETVRPILWSINKCGKKDSLCSWFAHGKAESDVSQMTADL